MTARKKSSDSAPRTLQITAVEEISRVDESRFTADMDDVVNEAEDMRLRYMSRHAGRSMLTMSIGMIVALLGAAGFGWYFLVYFDIAKAALCMIPALAVPLVMHPWSEAPIKAYVRDYKTIFMPKMAKAFGNFNFHAERGISREMLGKTGVIPTHDIYRSEDCFAGNYKGVKVIFSEARLYSKSKRENVFEGVFVLLEIPNNILEGHTIITADKHMVKDYAKTRWSKLSPVEIKVSNPDWDRFDIYSDKADSAALLVGEKLLKELAEAADVFNKADLTAVLFRGKFIFMMIPYSGNMFEASNVFVPVSTKQHALNCKKEIERILEIIDVFEIYRARTI